MALLEAAWNALESNCRELLKLHYYGNMKLIEIAEQRNMPPATVRKQKERCVDKIRNYFKKENKSFNEQSI